MRSRCATGTPNACDSHIRGQLPIQIELQPRDSLLRRSGARTDKYPFESVYFDDADTVTMLAALGLDPEVILAP